MNRNEIALNKTYNFIPGLPFTLDTNLLSKDSISEDIYNSTYCTAHEWYGDITSTYPNAIEVTFEKGAIWYIDYRDLIEPEFKISESLMNDVPSPVIFDPNNLDI